jgi:hypothetical protein
MVFHFISSRVRKGKKLKDDVRGSDLFCIFLIL